jgi:phage major head subunit gpT-like protein
MLTQGDALLKATAKAAFWQSYEQFPSIMAGLIAPVDSNADQETYPWLAYAPAVREMVGSRVKRGVPEISWTIKNKKWENTVAIAYETRKFSKLNQVQALLGGLGSKARAYPDKLTSSLIDNGNSAANVCYDTKKFFDTTHSDPGAAYTTSQSNAITLAAATGTTWTDIELSNAIINAKAALMGYKDGDADPVYMDQSVMPLIQCAVDIYPRIQAALTLNALTGGAGNPAKGIATVLANPYLTAVASTDKFYMFNVSGAHKPFILQTAEAVTLEDDMGGDNDFNTRDVSFGSFGYYNVGYGDWRYAVLQTAT